MGLLSSKRKIKSIVFANVIFTFCVLYKKRGKNGFHLNEIRTNGITVTAENKDYHGETSGFASVQ